MDLIISIYWCFSHFPFHFKNNQFSVKEPSRKLKYFKTSQEIIVSSGKKKFNCINLLQAQSLAFVPKPEATPFPEGHAVHVAAVLPAALQWSSGQF